MTVFDADTSSSEFASIIRSRWRGLHSNAACDSHSHALVRDAPRYSAMHGRNMRSATILRLVDACHPRVSFAGTRIAAPLEERSKTTQSPAISPLRGIIVCVLAHGGGALAQLRRFSLAGIAYD